MGVESDSGPVVVVLAAGEGRRMNSSRSKLLHQVGGHSLLRHALEAAEAIEPSQVVVVVGYQKEQVQAHLGDVAPGVLVAVQEQPTGPGDALRAGLGLLSGLGDDATILILCADLPLLQGVTLHAMIAAHRRDHDAATILGSGDTGEDAGAYVFDLGPLSASLAQAGQPQLADVVEGIRSGGGQVGTFPVTDAWQTQGVDDRVQLAAVSAEYNRRQVDRWMRAGVTVVDPATTWIEADVDVAPDVTLLPGVMLMGATSVDTGATIGPETTVKDSEIGERAVVARSTVELSVVGAGADVGPYARLRPGTQIGTAGVVGTFVETKNVIMGQRSRLGHLVYCGDATLGEGVDVGAGVVFANWDSTNRARVEVGDGAVIGAGSLIVPPALVPPGTVVPPGATVGPDETAPEAEPRRSSDDETPRRGMEAEQ